MCISIAMADKNRIELLSQGMLFVQAQNQFRMLYEMYGFDLFKSHLNQKLVKWRATALLGI